MTEIAAAKLREREKDFTLVECSSTHGNCFTEYITKRS